MTGIKARATEYRPGMAMCEGELSAASHTHCRFCLFLSALMLLPTVGQRATAGVLRHAYLLPRSCSFSLSLHTSYRFQHTQSSQRKPSLRENIYTFPNLLTVSRIAACPVLGWSILSDNYSVATCLLLYAGITDWVSFRDSFLAR